MNINVPLQQNSGTDRNENTVNQNILDFLPFTGICVFMLIARACYFKRKEPI